MKANEQLYRLQFRKSQQISLLTQLSHLVDAGVPAPDALQHIRKVYQEKKDQVLFMVVDQMCKNSADGKKLAEDMHHWFPYEICTILIKSEERGILSEGLTNILDYLNSSNKFFSPLAKMTSGIIYLIATLIAIAVIGYIYLPKIGKYAKVWPGLSKALYDLGGFLCNDYLLIILLLLGLFFWIIWATRNYNDKYYQCVALPFLPLYKAKLSYFILKIFSLLSANGIGIPEIINQLNQHYTKGLLSTKLNLMQQKLSAGEQNMGKVMDTGLFTAHQIAELHLIASFVGEENYSEIFQTMAKIISARISKSLSQIAVIVNLVCLLLTGAGILWIYGAYALLASSIN